MSRDGLVAPEPEPLPERDDWLATCPRCSQVVLAESAAAALDAWKDHDMEWHPQLPPEQRWGEDLLAALTDLSSDEGTWAKWAVRDYWRGWRLTDTGTEGFTGASFDDLGYVDGADPHPNIITATDIVAVSMLGVDVPAGASLMLLDPDDYYRINEALAAFDDRPLHEADWADLGPDSPPDVLWHRVREPRTAMGRTKASKLLARKRPNLLPVWDSRGASRMRFERSTNDWQWWWTWWQQDDHVAAVRELRGAAAAGERTALHRVSLLRVLDVAIWRYDKHYTREAGQPAALPTMPTGTVTVDKEDYSIVQAPGPFSQGGTGEQIAYRGPRPSGPGRPFLLPDDKA